MRKDDPGEDVQLNDQVTTRCDIAVGEVFSGGPKLGDGPLPRLLQVGNLGGFRPKKAVDGTDAYVVLFTTGTESDWPDGVDPSSGTFRYFGDNRTPGRQLLAGTGNKLLERIAHHDLDSRAGRCKIPPFFLFSAASNGIARSVRCDGLAVPSQGHWCVAKFFSSEGGQRFMNFEITLDVLADRVLTRHWIDELVDGVKDGSTCPIWYRHWIETGDSAVIRARKPSGKGKV